jgi:iron complex outermembrane receptor protein
MPVDENGAATREYCDQEVRYGRATPRVIANYNVNDDVMVFVSFARGYSAGGMNGDIRMRPFDPEISDNWEIGVKSRLADDRVQLNANVFFNDYTNRQITVSRMQRGQPTADLINAQKATLKGIEFELQATPIANLYLTASGGYFDGEYDEFSTMDTEFDAVTLEETEFLNDFSYLDYPSGTNWSLHAAYEVAMDNGGMITFGGGWSHRGRQVATLRSFSTSIQEAYGTLDARIVWEMPNNKTNLAIWGTNLNDKEYFNGSLDLPSGNLINGDTTDKYGVPIGQDLGVTIIYPAEPRRFGITLTHNLTN